MRTDRILLYRLGSLAILSSRFPRFI